MSFPGYQAHLAVHARIVTHAIDGHLVIFIFFISLNLFIHEIFRLELRSFFKGTFKEEFKFIISVKNP